jgi:hypothetical protein
MTVLKTNSLSILSSLAGKTTTLSHNSIYKPVFEYSTQPTLILLKYRLPALKILTSALSIHGDENKHKCL